MFVFRVSARRGLGHIMRMKCLAQELVERGQLVSFILCPGSDRPFLNRLLSPLAHSIHILEPCVNQDQDAQRCLALLAGFEVVHTVLLDHYDLGVIWEQNVVAAGYHTVAFDDLGREHVTHYLFDAKWVGEGSAARYANQLHARTKAMLGPQFCLLGAEYRQPKVRPRPAKVETKAAHQCKPTRPLEQTELHIMLSLGGGGDLRLLARIIRGLLGPTGQHLSLKFKVVIGPQAKFSQSLESLAAENAQVELVRHARSLYETYAWADLYVGALGTALYELAATQTPAVTFSLAPNQDNRSIDLADLGHYLHFPDPEVIENEAFIQLLALLCVQIERLRALRAQCKVEIDAWGSRRVAAVLLGQSVEAAGALGFGMMHKDHVAGLAPLAEFSEGLRIRAVADADLHAYRAARNQRNNASLSTVTRPVTLLEHYHWWFSTQRESFVLTRGETPLLFIWHQAHTVQEQGGPRDFYIGGWFTASEGVSFNLPWLALSWQLDHVSSQQPDAHWLAVIHRDNRFVQLLNQRMGFTPVTDAQRKASLRQLFPHANETAFHYLELAAGPGQGRGVKGPETRQ